MDEGEGRRNALLMIRVQNSKVMAFVFVWSAVGVHAGLLVQPEPHWGSVAPRYSSYYSDGSLRRSVPKRLGKGLHGEVLLGESSSSGEQVAIKVGFRRGDIDREASVLSAMAGVAGFPKVLLNEPPNEQSKGGVLVMELLGASLDELCQKIAPYTYLSGPTVMRVGRGALGPLHKLHVAGFVHNDVKRRSRSKVNCRLGQKVEAKRLTPQLGSCRHSHASSGRAS